MSFNKANFLDEIRDIASASTSGPLSQDVAQALDHKDPLAPLRSGYILPTMRDANVVDAADPDKTALYFCGNSLGPLTAKSKQYLHEQADTWGRKGVLGHWDSPYGRPWTKAEEKVSTLMSDMVGAKPSEVTTMSTLTANLHTMLNTFYRPQTTITSREGGPVRHKIIYEAKAFPSDQYALASAVTLAGFDPATSLVRVAPRRGNRTIHVEDILDTLEREAKTGELAMIMLAGIQYLSGQFFDMARITKRAKELDIIVGWDLAHAFANVPLSLHDWGVDFAVWCTYKYGCSGPGGIAGLFVHERWSNMGMTTNMNDEMTGQSSTEGLVRPAGWWGHVKSTRFAMPDSFEAMKGAAGWQLSNPSQLDLAALLGSLETLSGAYKLAHPDATLNIGSEEHAAQVNSSSKVGSGLILPVLRAKSQRLTSYLEMLLLSESIIPKEAKVTIVTPEDPEARGSQLSICIPNQERKSESTSALASPAAPTTNHSSDVPISVSLTTRVGRLHKNLETKQGVICDVRNPDMLRLAPLAHFSTYQDVWDLAHALRKALLEDMEG
ncbi:hypothetical protein CBS101457_003316 [Exobasidium rhododendri]|nr:hypothetical protein CBS101457_003316 [Exobasidium rhododendri]